MRFKQLLWYQSPLQQVAARLIPLDLNPQSFQLSSERLTTSPRALFWLFAKSFPVSFRWYFFRQVNHFNFWWSQMYTAQLQN